MLLSLLLLMFMLVIDVACVDGLKSLGLSHLGCHCVVTLFAVAFVGNVELSFNDGSEGTLPILMSS